MTPEPPWLSDQEQRLWRQWLRLSALLPAELHRRLQADSDLSLADFEVLVHLSEDPEGRVRVSDLARVMQWERSRLSHQFTRMQRRGLVTREECDSDARVAWVVLTAAGRTAIEQAAPGHVRAVRSLVFDALDEEERAVFGRVLDRLVARVEDVESPSR